MEVFINAYKTMMISIDDAIASLENICATGFSEIDSCLRNS